MTKEVGEITFEMEENMSNPMRFFPSFMDQIFIKWLARGILRKWGDEMMKRLFEASKEGLGRGLFVFGEDFGRSMWKLWRAMKEKLWEWSL